MVRSLFFYGGRICFDWQNLLAVKFCVVLAGSEYGRPCFMMKNKCEKGLLNRGISLPLQSDYVQLINLCPQPKLRFWPSYAVERAV